MRPQIQILSLAAPVRHALQALGALAADHKQRLGSATVARRFKLSATALSKSFQLLSQHGVLESRRGPGGGYRLAAKPEPITLAAVVAALGAQGGRRGRCLLEERPCGKAASCLLHEEVVAIDARMLRLLRRLTLADLAVGPKTASR